MNKDIILICPFCHTECYSGAKVCRGCQAEIKYNEQTFLSRLVWLIVYMGGIITSFMLYVHFRDKTSAFTLLALVIIIGRLLIVKYLKIKTRKDPQFYRNMKHGK